MKKEKKQKKIITKAKLKKGFMGSISILLCLLMTPFLSIALGLVEYSRYQQVLEITDELYELTGISTLSDYDDYLNRRFGLLAMSQEGDTSAQTAELLEENIKALGKQVTLGEATAVGKYSLGNTNVLRKQIVDISELTSTAAIIDVDFKLNELLQKLSVVDQFQEIMDKIQRLADLTDKLKDAVNALKELKSAAENLQSAINDSATKANDLAAKMKDFYKKLGEKGIVIPEEATDDQIRDALKSFEEDYLGELKNLYKDANALITSLKSVKIELDNIQTSFKSFENAVKGARTALGPKKTDNSGGGNKGVEEESKDFLESILQEMEKLAEEELNDFKNEAIAVAKNTLDNIVNQSLEEAGLADITRRYTEIVNGDYFSKPLSETAKADIQELLETVSEVYSSYMNNGTLDETGLLKYFKEKFVPNLGSITEIDFVTIIDGAITAAESALKNKLKESVMNFITNLTNLVKNLFDLDLFWETDMNACVNIQRSYDNPYQKFLDELGNLFTAIETFTEKITSPNILEKLFGTLGALKDMLKAIWNMLDAIKEIALSSIRNIANLATAVANGDVKNLYETLIISGYMRHNLPCRTDSGNKIEKTDGENVKLMLKGAGITGFPYNSIARPEAHIDQYLQNSYGFTQLGNLLNEIKAGHGNDKMFMGAELEYIRAGTNSEIANQIICFFDIYFLRLLIDLPGIFLNGEVSGAAATANIAGWVVYILYILGEPFCDTLLLVNGEKVPLAKSKCWLTPSGIGGFAQKMANATMSEELMKAIEQQKGEDKTEQSSNDDNNDEGSDYKTHLLILLLIHVDANDQIKRLADLITLEGKMKYGDSFDIDRAYTQLEISADVTFNPFFDLGTASGGESFMPTYEIKQTVGY